MLSFTNSNHQQSRLNHQGSSAAPLLIYNPQPLNNFSPNGFPNRPHKIISNSMERVRVASKSKEKVVAKIREEQWIEGGKISLFDERLGKNLIDREQKQLQIQLRKLQKKENENSIQSRERDIGKEAVQLQKVKYGEIQKLRKLIETEQQQKRVKDRVFEEKVRMIEKERQELIALERKIEQKGPQVKKEVRRELQVFEKQQIPSNDRAKCKQQINNHPSPHRQGTQEQDRHALRQQQLQILARQREQALKQPQLGYSSTLISLLSKASYKIISTHISTLVELFLDDLLQEQVYLLESIELEERLAKEKNRQQRVMDDYCQELGQFVDEIQEIEGKVGKYSSLNFADIYHPRHIPRQAPKEEKNSYDLIQMELSEDSMEQVLNRKDKFIRFVSNFDQYKRGNITMFEQVTEEVVNEAIDRLAKELDRGSGDFVQLVFRNELK